ncbi:hypothetical protein C1X72_27350 [Pseudomonas sp. FW306-2-2C-D06B]|nr:hypothetical protein C1X72_27350 [Pseudomonas sp. FW306-2-2C-D06B]PNA97985.1 hypothetical protein C1X74_12810 [Pseudomonas sp. GW460-5]PNB58681.1 hypothetical protein C1X73_13050 [Pseudomonas sp. FW305-130]PYG98220.1 hypothetical protein CVV67_22250 [Arthrobacter stackebrandtii]
MPRKGCTAAPAIPAAPLIPRGRCAALSRHKAAPTGIALAISCKKILNLKPNASGCQGLGFILRPQSDAV